jgi:predicted O-linked N-acetylglucosamine transferase (SPINDLY family)
VQIPPDRAITFGCFNDRSKLTTEVVATWSRILARVPGSRLVLKARQYADADINAELTDLFRQHGIDAARLEFQSLSLPGEYLAAYHAIDIALDPFPRHGGVTTADALWMGVPVVTLTGARFIERHSGSLLTAIGAQDWIAHDIDAYVEIAVALATAPARRNALRQTQRQRMIESPVCDPQGLARAMEGLYRQMWRHYLEAASPPVPAC